MELYDVIVVVKYGLPDAEEEEATDASACGIL